MSVSYRYKKGSGGLGKYLGTGFLSLILGGAGFLVGQDQVKPPIIVQSPSITCKVAFTPNGQPTNLIVNEINSAKSEILVQAYHLTSKPIISALLKRWGRGVSIKVLLDKAADKSEAFFALKKAKIPLLIDYKPSIAHNKVMIIDDQKVITGSFNFTTSAQTRNAENVIILDSPQIANVYKDNWISRWNASK